MSINIRSIQHYMYCPRRFGLLEVNGDWAENAFVVKADILHEKVHDGTHAFSDKNKIVLSSVSVYNDTLDIYGICDCIEFERNEKGSFIQNLGDRFNVKIIEYKPRQPKDSEISKTDAIQVFAQKVCADFVWKCNSECFVYYADVRRRVKLPFESDYNIYMDTLLDLLKKMSDCKEKMIIPEIIKGQKCSGCSLSDICMPKSKKESVKDNILKSIRNI